MNFNNFQFALGAIIVCLVTSLVCLLIKALAKYLNQDELVRNIILASLFVIIVLGFIIKGK